MDVNSHVIVGRVARDPFYKQVTRRDGSQIPMVLFTVISNRRGRNQNTGEEWKRADAHPCQAWGKMADVVNQYCKKGKEVGIQAFFTCPGQRLEDGTYKTYPTFVVLRLSLGQSPRNGAQASAGSTAQGEQSPPAMTPDQTATRIAELESEIAKMQGDQAQA